MELNKLFNTSQENMFGSQGKLNTFLRKTSYTGVVNVPLPRMCRRGSAEERSAGAAMQRARFTRRASMEIKGLDSFLSTSRTKKRKQLFDQRRQNEQRYEEMVSRLLIRARSGWARDKGIAKSYGISIIDKRPDDGPESKASDDAQSDKTSTTISTIQRNVTAKKNKLSIQAQRCPLIRTVTRKSTSGVRVCGRGSPLASAALFSATHSASLRKATR